MGQRGRKMRTHVYGESRHTSAHGLEQVVHVVKVYGGEVQGESVCGMGVVRRSLVVEPPEGARLCVLCQMVGARRARNKTTGRQHKR